MVSHIQHIYSQDKPRQNHKVLYIYSKTTFSGRTQRLFTSAIEKKTRYSSKVWDDTVNKKKSDKPAPNLPNRDKLHQDFHPELITSTITMFHVRIKWTQLVVATRTDFSNYQPIFLTKTEDATRMAQTHTKQCPCAAIRDEALACWILLR